MIGKVAPASFKTILRTSLSTFAAVEIVRAQEDHKQKQGRICLRVKPKAESSLPRAAPSMPPSADSPPCMILSSTTLEGKKRHTHDVHLGPTQIEVFDKRQLTAHMSFATKDADEEVEIPSAAA